MRGQCTVTEYAMLLFCIVGLTLVEGVFTVAPIIKTVVHFDSYLYYTFAFYDYMCSIMCVQLCVFTRDRDEIKRARVSIDIKRIVYDGQGTMSQYVVQYQA